MFGKGYIYVIIKGFFKLMLLTVILLVVGIFLWRFATSAPPDELMVISPNERLAEAYADGELKLVTQEQNTITRTEANYGYFSVADVVFIPEAEQLQILVKYNDSTLKALKTDYPDDFAHLGKKEYPDSSADWYDVSVVLARDITPDNKEDNLGSDKGAVELVRIKPTEVTESVHVGRYSYRRMVFDGVSLDSLTLAVYADFFYVGDLAYEREGFDIYTDRAYGTLCLYAYADKTLDVELSESDIEAIKSYK
jgi:hypothetical protein